MNTQSVIYLGVDISSGVKPFQLAAFDSGFFLLALRSMQLRELLTFVTGLEAVLVGINTPSGLNRGLVRHEEIQQNFITSLEKNSQLDIRLCEYELQHRGIHNITQTPNALNKCPARVKRGFNLYQKLDMASFLPYPANESNRQYMEISAEASYRALMKHHLFKARTLEGRLQRQLLLYDLGLPIQDPMRFFEEVTRYRLLNGIFPMELILKPHELNALVAAHTAWIAVNRPTNLVSFGDREEGLIYLPGQLNAERK